MTTSIAIAFMFITLISVGLVGKYNEYEEAKLQKQNKPENNVK